MIEMINRASKALDEAGFAWMRENGHESVGWADVPSEVFARAVIEAMREPTPAMIDSGVAFALCVTLGGDYRWSEYVADLHRAMTDAALTPTGDAQ